jgi:nitrogen fixation/metabolism regulation signal transduction histidine kinase
MPLKSYFLILAILLLGIMTFLIFVFSNLFSLYFYIAEGVILFTLFYLIVFYRKIVRPINSIGSGMDLLKEQDFSSRLRKVGQSDADRIVSIFNRMMDQLKNERLRLREQNHFLDLLINASPMGVLITTLDDEVSQLNPVAEKILNIELEEVIGKKISELKEPLATELARIPQGKSATIRLNNADIYKCSHSYFIDRGFHHPFYLIESLTEEVVKAEKRAYEKVIRMIAHEVNNTTAGITSTLDTIEQTLSETEGMESICEAMQVCSDRCFSMSRFITRFADVVKIPEPYPAPVDLNDLALTCKRFMEGMCADRDIRLKTEFDEHLPQIMADAALLEQVLVNILKNGMESIDRKGEIILRTSSSPVMLEVIDNGKGIDKETESKLFSPFFSTKSNGQGIGLIFIREVLLRHQCTFSLRTGEDGLTRFRILFP